MKKTGLFIALSTVILAGCESMLYTQGAAVAPIVAHDYRTQNNNVPVPAPTKTVKKKVVKTAPATASKAPKQEAVATPATSTQATSPNPYQSSTQTANNTLRDDGWNVPSATDTPKVEKTPATASASVETAKIAAPAEKPKTDTQDHKALRPEMPEESKAESKQEVVVAKATVPEKEVTPAPAPAQSGGDAASLMLKQASQALKSGDLDSAVGYLENASRIEPNNSKILYDIANIRYHQGKYREAESFASRAVQAGGGNAMIKKSWSLIANARKALGDNQGAITAAERAASL